MGFSVTRRWREGQRRRLSSSTGVLSLPSWVRC